MQQVQLFAQIQGATGSNSYVELDLNPAEPIKITKSVQDIEDSVSNNSSYVQPFKLPNTPANAEYFKGAFFINSNDYDPTIKTLAYLKINGNTIMSGNIRLEDVISSPIKGSYEYEILFMGEISTFSSALGDRTLADFNSALLAHDISSIDIYLSWVGSLLNGDVIYPLCEWGYKYDSNNVPINTTLSYYTGTTGGMKGFTNIANKLSPYQFKPFVRLRYIWDLMFSETGFEFDSNFINSMFFDQLYFINTNKFNSDEVLNITGEFEGLLPQEVYTPYFYEQLAVSTKVKDPNNCWKLKDQIYTATRMGSHYIAAYFKYQYVGSPNPIQPVPGYNAIGPLNIKVTVNNIQVDLFSVTNILYTSPITMSDFWYANTFNLNVGDVVRIYFNPAFNNPGLKYNIVTSGKIIVYVNDGISPLGMYSDKYKQIDLIKSINDRFKLIWEPDKNIPNKFKIEPWIDWIKGGNQLNWTDKLDESKDIKITPLFKSQPKQINYIDQEDTDVNNYEYQKNSKKTFGQLSKDSEIDLLKDIKEVKSIFAPTPISEIGGGVPNFEIPHFGKDNGTKIEPIEVKPRILFYNGLIQNGATNSLNLDWYFDMSGTSIPLVQSNYPLISGFNSIPNTSSEIRLDYSSFDINFSNDKQVWSSDIFGDGRTNDTAFNRFWKKWWDFTYNHYGKIMEATFKLDSNDIINLNFNDKIFIKDSWWLPMEIKEYVVGEINSTKVTLVKLGEEMGVGIDVSPEAPIKQIDVCYSPTDPCSAYCCLGIKRYTVYTDGSLFSNSYIVYATPTISIPAQAGYYKEGDFVYQVNSNGIIISIVNALTLSCRCIGNLTRFTGCWAETSCDACCCTGFDFEVWGDGTAVGNSTHLFGDPVGTTLLIPGSWWIGNGESTAVQIGNDGTTIVSRQRCSGCRCNGNDGGTDVYSHGDDPYQTCCQQGTLGLRSVYNNYVGTPVDKFFIDNSTMFSYDPFYDFPVGGTSGIPTYMSDGKKVTYITNGDKIWTESCDYSSPCEGRTQIVNFNLHITSTEPCNITTRQWIAGDRENYLWAGELNSSTYGASVSSDVYYDPNSTFRVSFKDIISPSLHIFYIQVLKNSVTVYEDHIIGTDLEQFTPGYLVGTDTWDLNIEVLDV